ncbi:ATP-binding protein [Phytohabitans flavus]|nr:LuxR family transcriptional regulator [Phytohabitans flavus]
MALIERELVERDHELKYLESLYGESATGRGRVAVISGPVATGKTQLLHNFAERAAASGALVLWAVASPSEQTLPLGVIDQMLHSAQLPAEAAEQINQLLDNGYRTYWQSGAPELAWRESAAVLRGLSKALLEVTERTSLVICVDDVHYADLPSLQCLSSVARRLRNTRAMMVLTESARLQPAYPLFQEDVLRNSHRRAVQLEPLTRFGVARVLAPSPELSGPHVAAECHALTGGNPLLLQSLIEDSRLSAATTGRVIVGDAFAEAVLSCLYRCEAPMLQVARGLAVVGTALPAATLARLLDLDTEIASRAVHLLNRAGLLDAGRFRHPRVRNAVLASMIPEARAAMHGQVAKLLHSAGEPASVVAGHLVEADWVDAPWVLSTLKEAAEIALSGGDFAFASTCLRTARGACLDDRQRAEITSMLTQAKWRVDPADALPHLSELVAAARSGLIDCRHSVTLVGYLLWHGRLDEAIELLDRICTADSIDAEAADGIYASLLWLASSFPEYAERVRGYWTELERHWSTPTAQTLPLQAARVLSAITEHGPNEEAVSAAEQVLQRTHLNDKNLMPASVALSTLILADRLGSAAAWCDSLLGEAAAGNAPTWQAVLFSLQAEIAQRQGDLTGAEEHAQSALRAISMRGWGVVIGRLLSTLVHVNTATGRYEEAANFLSERVPAEMFRTSYGLQYLYARGNYYLATDRPRAALSDFQTCGDTANVLGLELPELAPWRLGLAQAYLALKGPRQSRALVGEQLRLLGEEGQQWVRGVALRVLASVSEPARRLPLLKESVELLEAGGDRLETALALADLSDALRDAGDPSRARLTLRTARYFAKQCQAHALLRRLQPEVSSIEQSTTALVRAVPNNVEGITSLSEAERRVAALAAIGHTNREIAGKLYITVSTVEQHMTRIFRKLRVKRRSDLPPGLHVGIADTA